jgi:HK97 family phage portal protein
VTFLRGLFESRESRSIQNPAVPLTATTLVDWLHGGPAGDSGIQVSETGSLAMTPVWRAVNLIAGTCAALPLRAYRGLTQVPARVIDNPHPDMTPFEVGEQWFIHLCLWGNSYSQKVYDQQGRLSELWPIDPAAVRVGRRKPYPGNPSGKVFTVGPSDIAYTPDDIFHIPGFGYDGITGVSPIRVLTQTVGLGLAAEKYAARLFGSGSLMSGILQTEQRLTPEIAERLKTNWKTKVAGIDKAHDIAVLDSGAKWQSVSIPPVDAQMIDSRKFQVIEIARAFGIPPHLVGDVERSTSWGTGIEQQSIGFVVYTLRPWLTRVEQRLSKDATAGGATPAGTIVKYDTDGLMRGDAVGRATYYQIMRNIGVLSANDIRDAENWEPIPNGDEYLTIPVGGIPQQQDLAKPEKPPLVDTTGK